MVLRGICIKTYFKIFDLLENPNMINNDKDLLLEVPKFIKKKLFKPTKTFKKQMQNL